MSVVVGTGVVIVNSKGEVLLGKRSGKHAPYWS
ncbi:ADP-ribose pyrophosphatase, partial [Escherichia coli]